MFVSQLIPNVMTRNLEEFCVNNENKAHHCSSIKRIMRRNSFIRWKVEVVFWIFCFWLEGRNEIVYLTDNFKALFFKPIYLIDNKQRASLHISSSQIHWDLENQLKLHAAHELPSIIKVLWKHQTNWGKQFSSRTRKSFLNSECVARKCLSTLNNRGKHIRKMCFWLIN